MLSRSEGESTRGSKSSVEVRQGKEENYRPELYVVPGEGSVKAALANRISELAKQYPGVAIEDQGSQIRVTIPDSYRVGHEAHFAQVTNAFFGYLRNPAAFPAWENPNMLAKYEVSTRGVDVSHVGRVGA